METLSEIRENGKEWWEGNRNGFFWAFLVFFAILFAGGAFRLLMLWQAWSPIVLLEDGDQTGSISEEKLTEEYMIASGLPGLVAASRNGKRYYYPWCGGLARIKEANKIWFKTGEAAEHAGYAIASGCDKL